MAEDGVDISCTKGIEFPVEVWKVELLFCAPDEVKIEGWHEDRITDASFVTGKSADDTLAAAFLGALIDFLAEFRRIYGFGYIPGVKIDYAKTTWYIRLSEYVIEDEDADVTEIVRV